MVERLRLIAVHVEEPRRGQYAWVLTEGEGDRWPEIDRQSEPVPTYKQAMAEGLLALQTLIEDLDFGPRAELARDSSSADNEKEASLQRSKGQSAGIGMFGFGPVP